MRLLRPAIAALVSICAQSTALAALDSGDPAAKWSTASSSERRAFARQAASACKSSNCGDVEIKACLDEALRPPVPAAARRMSLAEAAASCIVILRSQQ